MWLSRRTPNPETLGSIPGRGALYTRLGSQTCYILVPFRGRHIGTSFGWGWNLNVLIIWLASNMRDSCSYVHRKHRIRPTLVSVAASPRIQT